MKDSLQISIVVSLKRCCIFLPWFLCHAPMLSPSKHSTCYVGASHHLAWPTADSQTRHNISWQSRSLEWTSLALDRDQYAWFDLVSWKPILDFRQFRGIGKHLEGGDWKCWQSEKFEIEILLLTNCAVDEMSQCVNTKRSLSNWTFCLSFRDNQLRVDILQIPFERFAL